MSGSWIGIVEMALVFGGVLVFGFWQLYSLRKYKKQDAETRAAAAREEAGKNDAG